jgi:nanoRNase/pAp phosphatase (c-di-AMP/oligoRNAs hydrolase)
MMPFQYDGKTKLWIISIYSTKKNIDCSELARKYKGGGHFSAAGMQVLDISQIFGIK